jgi:O-antigen/teichoic acid export membrane protein
LIGEANGSIASSLFVTFTFESSSGVMSNHFVKPSARPPGQRFRRLQFRSITEHLEEQATGEIPAATPDRGKQRGEFLPAQQQVQAGLLSINRSVRTNHYKVPVPSQKDASTTQKLSTPTFAPTNAGVLVTGQNGAAAGVRIEEESPDFDLHFRMIGGIDTEMIQTAPLFAIPKSRINTNGRRIELASLPARQAVVTVRPATTDPLEVESFGFDIDDSALEKQTTLPMMVLKGMAKEQGKQQAEMKSEVSGAASAAGLMGISNVLGKVLLYVSTFLIQYSFGPAVYGLYTLSTSLINLISSIFSLGMGDAMLRYVAIYRSKQKPRLLLGITLFCTAVAGAAGLLGALLLLYFTPVFVGFIAVKHGGAVDKNNSLVQVGPVLQMMAPLIPLFGVQLVWQSGLRGFKAFKFRVLVSNVFQPIVQILLMILVILFYQNITGIVIALLISTLFSTVLNFYFLFKQVARVTIARLEQYELREWLVFASLNFLTTVTDNLLYFMDAVLLAVFSVSVAQIGQYGAATRISNFIALPLLSLNNIFAPTIAELHSKGERVKLEAMFKVITKWTITFSLPIFLVSALFSPFLLGISGAGFVPASTLVIALAVGALLNVGTGPVGYMLVMTGYNKLSFLNSLVAVIANVALGVLLIPQYGAMGTAIGTGVSVSIVNLMRLLQVGILLKMHPYRWDVFKPLGAGLLSSAVIGAMFYLLSISHFKLFIVVGHAIIAAQLLLIPVFLILYTWILSRFKNSPEDEIVLKAMRKKFLRGRGKGKGNGKNNPNNKNDNQNKKEQKEVTYA